MIDNKLSAIFAATLRKLRLEKGLSQEALALDADIERAYVSMLERSKRVPSLTTVFALSKALGIKPSELVKEIELQTDK